MAGIYLHIPFCTRRCIYCDFYSTTCPSRAEEYVAALCREVEARRDFLHTDDIRTVYFGGGTPSLLTAEGIARVLHTIGRCYHLSPEAEITLEANPDDVTPEWLAALRRHTAVNRLSLGIQTFDEEALRFLGRRHTAFQAVEAVRRACDAGFTNLSIDLIYGLPDQSLAQWEHNIDTALSLPVSHLSAYALIYEPGTRLYKLREAGRVAEADEELSVQMFARLIDRLTHAGFEHYEISNFARPGRRSRHNSSYWQGVEYLGCGPSAHSFNGSRRQWNTPELDTYLAAAAACPEGDSFLPPMDFEDLSPTDRYNDRILTAIRTADGLDLARLEADFGSAALDYCLRMAAPHLAQGTLERTSPRAEARGEVLKLTRSGIFVSDGIMSDLMSVD